MQLVDEVQFYELLVVIYWANKIAQNISERTKFLKTLVETYKRASRSKEPEPEVSSISILAASDPEQDSMLSAPSTDYEKKKFSSLMPSGKSTSLEDRLQYHREQQDALTESLLHQTSILKRNAMALGSQLEKDKDTVTNAMHALDRNADNMKRTGGRLTQYRELSAIGWKFYIVSVFVMFLAVLVALIVIKLLPKW